MSRLTTLDLSRNELGGNLSNIVVSPKLEYLNLSSNQVSGAIPVGSGWFS